MTCVLDASALVAFLLKESGHDVVEAVVRDGAAMSPVNTVEVSCVLQRMGWIAVHIDAMLDELKIVMLSVDRETARLASSFESDARRLGLSLGDRWCLATAVRGGLPVVTSDRSWADIADARPEIRIIR